MKMELCVRKTNELDPGQKDQIRALFHHVFGLEKSPEKFRAQFEQNAFGYSYHGLLLDGDRIVGCYTAIPFHYLFFGERVRFAESVDTMIHPDYRGSANNLKGMGEAVYETLKADGFAFVFGTPNERIYSSRKRKLRWADVAELDFYVLPIRIGAMARPLGMFDWASRAFARRLNAPLLREPADWSPSPPMPIEKADGEEFADYRFRKCDPDRYKVIPKPGGHFVYKLETVEGVRMGHLLDVVPLNRANLQSAVAQIHRDEAGGLDMIAYVGRLPFRPRNLFRLPSRLRPRKVRVGGRILAPGRVDERVFDAAQWNLNLSNFDFA